MFLEIWKCTLARHPIEYQIKNSSETNPHSDLDRCRKGISARSWIQAFEQPSLQGETRRAFLVSAIRTKALKRYACSHCAVSLGYPLNGDYHCNSYLHERRYTHARNYAQGAVLGLFFLHNNLEVIKLKVIIYTF